MSDIERVVAKGDKHRSVANTVMNTNRYVSITSTTHYLIQYQLYLTIPLVIYSDRHLTVPNTHYPFLSLPSPSSSRSHLLLILTVEGHDKVSGTITEGRLTLVDLAGSERISRTEAKGIRLVEAAAINKSLSALGQVCFLLC